MRSLILVIMIMSLYSCAMPKTSQEYISTYLGDGNKSIVDRPFEKVIKKNTELFNECYSKRYKMVTAPPYSTTITMGLLREINKAENSVIYALREVKITDSGTDDGLYVFAARVDKISKSKTQITTYTVWGHGRKDSSFHDWSSGKSSECPSLIF